MKIFVVILMLATTGCAHLLGLPKLNSEDVPTLVQRIAESDASICAWVGGRGGSGVGAVPTPAMGGGYGSGEILLGRVNADNTTLTIKNGECEIKRGGAE